MTTTRPDELDRLAELFDHPFRVHDDGTVTDAPGVYAPTVHEAGVLTQNEGIVVSLSDGTEFQITVVKSR